MKELCLSRGFVAVIDDEDYEWANQWKWYCTKAGYAARNKKVVDKKTLVYLHRELLKVEGPLQVDHINGNKLDNRRFNLRTATIAQNNRNGDKLSTNTTGYKGVSWSKAAQKYVAQIHANSVKFYLGLFSTKEEAALAYNEAATVLHGRFAKLNEVKRCE